MNLGDSEEPLPVPPTKPISGTLPTEGTMGSVSEDFTRYIRPLNGYKGGWPLAKHWRIRAWPGDRGAGLDRGGAGLDRGGDGLDRGGAGRSARRDTLREGDESTRILSRSCCGGTGDWLRICGGRWRLWSTGRRLGKGGWLELGRSRLWGHSHDRKNSGEDHYGEGAFQHNFEHAAIIKQ